MTFTRKVAAGFGALILLNAGIAVFCVGVVRSDLNRNAGLTARYAEDLNLVERMRLSSEEMVSASRAYLLTGDAAYLERTEATRVNLVQDTRAAKDRFETRTDAHLLDEIEGAVREYQAALVNLGQRRSATTDPRALADHFEDSLKPRRDDLRAALREYVHYRAARLDDALANSRSFDTRATALLAVAAALGLALSLGLAWALTRRLASQYQSEQAANGRAQRASQQREDLLAIVSHDLRSPLQAIALGAQLLRRKDGELAPEDGARALASIERAAARMKHLIADLLDAASIGQGRLAVTPESCGLAELVQEAADLAAPIAASKSLAFHVECPGEPTAVVVDRGRILQVLSNLLDNAMKFTPEGGEVRLEVAEVPDGVLFTVRDTGQGIEREHLPRLFDRYWQAGPSDGRGVGLGLFITKGIVEAHRGRLWVDSAVAQGSAFRFVLPASPATVAGGHLRLDRHTVPLDRAAVVTGRPA